MMNLMSQYSIAYESATVKTRASATHFDRCEGRSSVDFRGRAMLSSRHHDEIIINSAPLRDRLLCIRVFESVHVGPGTGGGASRGRTAAVGRPRVTASVRSA